MESQYSCRQMLSKESQLVAAQNVCRIGFTVSAPDQFRRDHLQISNRIKLMRNRLPTEAAIKIGTDPGMLCIACHLADMIDVCDQYIQGYFFTPASVFSQPANFEECVQWNKANYPIAF